MSPISPVLFRKIIHVIAGSLFIYCATEFPSGRLVLAIVTSGVFLGDILRKRIPVWNTLFLSLFKQLLKSQEVTGKISGATTLMLGLYITYLIFPTDVFITSAGVVVLADPIAAVGGKWLNFIPIKHFKSIGGSILFFTVSLLMVQGYGNIPLIPALIITIILSVSELLIISRWENFILIVEGALLIHLVSVSDIFM